MVNLSGGGEYGDVKTFKEAADGTVITLSRLQSSIIIIAVNIFVVLAIGSFASALLLVRTVPVDSSIAISARDGDVKTFKEADGFKIAGGNGAVISVKPQGFLVDDGKSCRLLKMEEFARLFLNRCLNPLPLLPPTEP